MRAWRRRESARQEEEARKQAAEEARRKAEEEAKKAAEERAKRKAEEVARRRAEEDRVRAEAARSKEGRWAKILQNAAGQTKKTTVIERVKGDESKQKGELGEGSRGQKRLREEGKGAPEESEEDEQPKKRQAGNKMKEVRQSLQPGALYPIKCTRCTDLGIDCIRADSVKGTSCRTCVTWKKGCQWPEKGKGTAQEQRKRRIRSSTTPDLSGSESGSKQTPLKREVGAFLKSLERLLMLQESSYEEQRLTNQLLARLVEISIQRSKS